MDLAQRVATRYMQRLADATTPSIENALAELAALRQLDINLDEVETTFGMHYKIAAEIDPEVKTQFQTLQKAREGLKSAQQVAKSVEEILKFFPEDKTALRAKSDAEVMIKRFQKHEADAGKIIETLSKKVLPETLKKMAKAAAKLIEERLVNPDHLRITPWQSNVFKAVVFQMVFTIDRKADPPPPQSAKLILEEDTGKTVGPMIYGQFGQSKPATARDFADAFLKNLQVGGVSRARVKPSMDARPSPNKSSEPSIARWEGSAIPIWRVPPFRMTTGRSRQATALTSPKRAPTP
jgi:hypothetical protein